MNCHLQQIVYLLDKFIQLKTIKLEATISMISDIRSQLFGNVTVCKTPLDHTTIPS